MEDIPGTLVTAPLTAPLLLMEEVSLAVTAPYGIGTAKIRILEAVDVNVGKNIALPKAEGATLCDEPSHGRCEIPQATFFRISHPIVLLPLDELLSVSSPDTLCGYRVPPPGERHYTALE